MPSIKVDFGTTSAPLLWNVHEHKRGKLESITIDNQSLSGTPVGLRLLDCFATDVSKTGSTGATQAAEYLGVSGVLSGRVRFQQHVTSGQVVTLKEEELKGMDFLGVARSYSPDAGGRVAALVITARYKLL